jgi:hypothetical protein
MRWRELFEDLEAQAVALDDAELRSEIADRTRAELATVDLARRLHVALGRDVDLRLLGGTAVHGVLTGWGRDWLLVEAVEEVVVSAASVVIAGRLAPQATTPDGIGLVESRTSIRSVLRALARDRSAVSVRLVDGSHVFGTPDRVGADWLDVAAHDPGEAPRPSAVHGRWTVSFAAIAAVCRRPGGWE